MIITILPYNKKKGAYCCFFDDAFNNCKQIFFSSLSFVSNILSSIYHHQISLSIWWWKNSYQLRLDNGLSERFKHDSLQAAWRELHQKETDHTFFDGQAMRLCRTKHPLEEIDREENIDDETSNKNQMMMIMNQWFASVNKDNAWWIARFLLLINIFL